MDWNLKAASWDLSEIDEATLSNIETVDGSSRFGEIHRTKGEFSVDLKLGQVGNSVTTEPLVPKWKDAAAGVSKATSSPSGPSKRARAVNNGSQRVSCLVDGCNSDLSNCRDYHRRHKVCEIHSKTPQVTIGGQKQRFCQQCSRFHSLEEFDEGKRSCRKRLDGHNRRRRKPQPEPLTRSGSFFSNYQGTQLLPFSSSHVYPSSSMMNPGWSSGIQQMHLVDKQDLFLGSSPSPTSYKEGNKQQLAFIQGDNNPTFINPSVSHALLSSSQSGGDGIRSKTLFSDSLSTSSDPVHDSHCALSLLSSPHMHTPSGNGLNQMVQQQHSSISFMQPLGLSLHDDHSLRSVDSVLVPNGSETNVLCPTMYNMGSDGSQGNEATPQPYPFHWE